MTAPGDGMEAGISTPDPLVGSAHGLHAVRARAEAATPGPWVSSRESGFDLHFGSMHFTKVDASSGNLFAVANLPLADAEFIAHARTDIPALLDALDVALRERDAARETLGRVEALCGKWDRVALKYLDPNAAKAARLVRAALDEPALVAGDSEGTGK